MVPARFCIALVVALAVGADAALPAFAVGTWELVNPDANSDWAEAYTQIADGTFTGYGSWTDAGQAYTYTYYGAFTVQDCTTNTDGTMSTVNAFWWVESGDYPTAPGMMRMMCIYVTWSGSDASTKRKGSFRSAEVPVGTPLGECPLLPPHLVADIPLWMEVYGEVTVDPDDERKYKCVADCEPQPWDCDAASTEDKGSRKKKRRRRRVGGLHRALRRRGRRGARRDRLRGVLVHARQGPRRCRRGAPDDRGARDGTGPGPAQGSALRRRRPSRFGAADHAAAAASAGSGAPLHAVEAGVLAGAGC